MTATAGESSTAALGAIAEPALVSSISDLLPDIVERLAATPELRECGACQQYLAAALELISAHLRPVVSAPPVALTARERDVLTLLAGGMSAQQIARRLEISAATVRKHLEHAYAKLDVHDRLTATIRMRELDLLPD
ncbi:response regulator transcription factor [Solicola gregarius]|uniref:Helix-turn-helix transcriptional regulator n=1 Tax=Solicola gregarius TaxID=2908642 RepID=A0AA46YLZ3_9ACTN|nr:helix-turn-helix transcriptional regulator [Solicola gregarius]UYM07182.1 helix-turn-helix transcriptional regulator [Solicola gregarius]